MVQERGRGAGAGGDPGDRRHGGPEAGDLLGDARQLDGGGRGGSSPPRRRAVWRARPIPRRAERRCGRARSRSASARLPPSAGLYGPRPTATQVQGRGGGAASVAVIHEGYSDASQAALIVKAAREILVPGPNEERDRDVKAIADRYVGLALIEVRREDDGDQDGESGSEKAELGDDAPLDRVDRPVRRERTRPRTRTRSAGRSRRWAGNARAGSIALTIIAGRADVPVGSAPATMSAVGTLTLYIGMKPVSQATIMTQPGFFGEGVCVARGSASSVSPDYRSPFRFTGGTIDRVVVDVVLPAHVDHEKEDAAWLMWD